MWVALPELGLLATTDDDGRFLFNRVPAGRHTIVARTREGGEATASVQVPGGRADLEV